MQKDSKRALFLLFEENPHWYSIGGEAVLQIAESKAIKVCVFGNKQLLPLDRSRGWARITPQRKILLDIFRKTRFYIWRFIPSVRPSRRLRKILDLFPAVEIIGVPDNRKRKPIEIEAIPQKSLIENIVIESLKEDYGTTRITKPRFLRLKQKYLESGLKTAATIKAIILLHKIEEVHLINGRTLYERIAYETAKMSNVSVFTYESEISSGKIQRYEGIVFNSDLFVKLVEEFWEKSVLFMGLENCVAEGSNYFFDRKRLTSINRFIHDFKVKSTSNTLGVKIFTYFSSSNDEIDALYSIFGEFPPKQDQIIRELVEMFEQQVIPNSHLVIRMHPNIKNKSKEEQKNSLTVSQSENVTFYDFESGVNSYDLLEHSQVVLTCGSTIGLEAAFAGIPNVSFGKTFWSRLSISDYLDEIKKLPNHVFENVENMKSDAIKVGFFFVNYGEEFKYFDLSQKRYIPENITLDVFQKYRGGVSS